MNGHLAVKFLAAALAKAEEMAKAATAGPWVAHRYTWDGDGFEASIGHNSEADVIGHGYEGGGVVEWVDAQFIAAFSPDVVLRLVAGARTILAEHQPREERPQCCRVCISAREDLYPEQWESDRWPCRTVLLLAQAWGWEEEGS